MELTPQSIIAEYDRRNPYPLTQGETFHNSCTVNICYSCLRQVITDKAMLKSARISLQSLSSCINQLSCGGWKRNCYEVKIGELKRTIKP